MSFIIFVILSKKVLDHELISVLAKHFLEATGAIGVHNLLGVQFILQKKRQYFCWVQKTPLVPKHLMKKKLSKMNKYIGQRANKHQKGRIINPILNSDTIDSNVQTTQQVKKDSRLLSLCKLYNKEELCQYMVTWSNRVPYFFLLRISHPFCSKTSKIVTQFSRNFFFTHLPPRQNKTRVSFKKYLKKERNRRLTEKKIAEYIS
ncbi:hypothetical protein BpHYR1_052213 [Brachionus plicatilis]|uniref:Uncharacterized protein n=1 Tax=Brachionus plicatilis TaxID=10195 RepID=A0A3M7PYE1_BRAPC|nr:hypothetical protein BpHYR1_052213 [Brachionus plicatilis]